MVTTIAILRCPGCGEERLLERADDGGWFCQVCGQSGPGAGATAAAPDIMALLAGVVPRHLTPGTWQVAAIAPLGQWPRSLQRELRLTLGARAESVLLVLERVP